MAVCILLVTKGRASVAEPVTVMHDQTVLVFRFQTGQAARGWTFFLRPFHPLVYALIGGCLLSVLVLLLLLETCHWLHRETQRSSSGSSETRFERILVNVELVVAGLLNKCKPRMLLHYTVICYICKKAVCFVLSWIQGCSTIAIQLLPKL